MLPSDWPTKTQVQALVELIVPLFFFAAIVCRYTGTKGGDPKGYLNKILEYQESNFSQLDRTYLPVLDQLLIDQEEEVTEAWLSTFRGFVGSIVILESPLSAISLGRLLQIPQKQVKGRLDSLHSILNFPDDEDVPIRLLHFSFRELLSSTHRKLESHRLEVMSKPSGLRQNMCSLSGLGTLRSEIDESTVTNSLPPGLQYACRYWVDHLEQDWKHINEGDTMYILLQTHFLHWLEAISLIRETNKCVHILERLQT
ncbi:hypothetical protein GQ43DRAFT_446576 [Delitschia confertaspora ATCC 74209]|uniref:Uncharacterized protein n=1 Tax=Delitschia confertaspora ATCC 74209 TaxID=1513339 RepID=A0A9P4N2D3_9PLEO|nr:hypothetical protein GQ43DRAFT_446576 [Delitschia confertaspora ATCC 74209]